jgi:BarA-like signal transduction histidine kinase
MLIGFFLFSRFKTQEQMARMQTDKKARASVESNHLRDSEPVLVETPKTELNCIDQLMQDHIASCLARSIDPFPRESLQGSESQETMYVFRDSHNLFSELTISRANSDGFR